MRGREREGRKEWEGRKEEEREGEAREGKGRLGGRKERKRKAEMFLIQVHLYFVFLISTPYPHLTVALHIHPAIS